MNTTARVAFWWIVFFNIVDAALTALILQSGGVELNPIMLWHINTFGLMGLVYGKTVVLLALGLVVYRLWDRLTDRAKIWMPRALVTIAVFMSGLAVYSSVVLYNLAG